MGQWTDFNFTEYSEINIPLTEPKLLGLGLPSGKFQKDREELPKRAGGAYLASLTIVLQWLNSLEGAARQRIRGLATHYGM